MIDKKLYDMMIKYDHVKCVFTDVYLRFILLSFSRLFPCPVQVNVSSYAGGKCRIVYPSRCSAFGHTFKAFSVSLSIFGCPVFSCCCLVFRCLITFSIIALSLLFHFSGYVLVSIMCCSVFGFSSRKLTLTRNISYM